MELRTADLFLSAYLLNNKISLTGVQIDDRQRKKIVFVFPKTNEVLNLTNAFKFGQATTNVLEFKKNFQHVQDLLHESFREYF